MIGFVGLVVPHVVRLLVRSDHRKVLPVATVLGAIFTVLADLLARTIVAPQEMPIGAVFDRRERAEQVIADMRTTVADVQATVAGRSPVSVFVYDSGQDAPFPAPARAMPNALIALAGGHNVFADLDQSWTSVSWEKVVAADADCILINEPDVVASNLTLVAVFLHCVINCRDTNAFCAACDHFANRSHVHVFKITQHAAWLEQPKIRFSNRGYQFGWEII